MLYPPKDYILKPCFLIKIEASRSQVQRDINVVVESKKMLFERNIAVPPMVSSYQNGLNNIWVINKQSASRIISKGMYIGLVERFDEGHLCVIADSLEGLNTQHETSKSITDIQNIDYSLMISPELSDE
ncbi:transposon Ty3-G Gag-Pol polyprotein [Nephila pilipes]|uniref:Transposon Ty3-G Gag-Pol polyprotein n=1 Tax=Nephila pilipes TaxID=299642 RepID=A0A8X6NUP2_NEPPI|nr:transposon Ty3-G Gag-Pol polyprotein [Nephila pilipes]